LNLRLEEIQQERLVTGNHVAASIGYGSFTGLLAGLVGLGGAEERIPFLLYYLRLPLEDMLVANLLISFATSGLNFAVRINGGIWSLNAAYVSAAMIVGSIPGAYAGALLSHRASKRTLKRFIALLLSFVIARAIYGLIFIPGGSGQATVSTLDLVVSAISGLGVGIISGSAGVAGGEYRIPILTYLVGLPIKIAGTASQLVSLPTIAIAVWRHKRLGFLSKRSLVATAMLGIPSVVAASLTGFFVAGLPTLYVDLVFIAILGYTIFRLVSETGQNLA
jgi:uncharacterized membrane protein YfcA